MTGMTRTVLQALAMTAALVATLPAQAQAPAASATAAQAQNSIDSLQASQQGGNVVVKLTLKTPLSAPPGSFSVANPPRIAFDFPATVNALGRTTQPINEGELRSVNVVQAGDRTRVVLNLNSMMAFTTRVDGNAFFVTLAGQPASVAARPSSSTVTHFAESRPSDGQHGLRGINFRRGKDGEGRIVVDLSDASTGIDIRQQGPNLVVEFLNTRAPDELRRKLDVTDFATPVTTISTLKQGDNVRMVITPTGLWEHNAYQSENQFVIEIKRIIEDPNKLVQGARGRYQGEKLSLNFQNIDVRAVLQVIADFTNFNIITSESVTGNLTLRLKDVPWDQALDIILQAKGLDMRKNGNVIWIAPRDEIATREKLELESRVQITDLEQLRTESFQLNYHKAADVRGFLTTAGQTVLSKRGSVVFDDRSNKLFVTDVGSRLDDIRRLIKEIDIAKRQVLIEARIVEATTDFSRNLGIRFGYHDNSTTGHRPFGLNSPKFSLANFGQTQLPPATPAIQVNNPGIAFAAPALGLGGVPAAVANLILFNNAATQVLNLEISALQADGLGKLVSSPRVVTGDSIEALIESGVEIPYQQATSSGATSVSFRKANLSLKVKPQITPDGRVLMSLDVNRDTPGDVLPDGVAINTRHVKTEVLVENGGTVVIGGIYQQDQRDDMTKVPFFGDIPGVGVFFRSTEKRNNTTELLVFITPRVVSDALTLR